MYKAVVNHAKKNAKALKVIPAFEKGIDSLDLAVEAMNLTAQQQEADTTGITGDKNTLKALLSKLVYRTANALHAWADDKGNATLKNAVAYTLSELQIYKDDKLSAVCKDIWEKGGAHREALKEYGLTDQLLDSLNTTLTNFNRDASNPRTAMGDRSGITKRLVQLFSTTDSLLKNKLDKTATLPEEKHPDCYQSYLTVRKIVNAPGARRDDDDDEEKKQTITN